MSSTTHTAVTRGVRERVQEACNDPAPRRRRLLWAAALAQARSARRSRQCRRPIR